MRQIGFRQVCIALSLLFTLVLFFSIATLFLVPHPKEVLYSLRTKEMIYSLKMSVITATIAMIFSMLLAIPIGYALSRFSFYGKNIIKSIADLPMAFPELVLGLALLLLFSKTPLGSLLQDIGIKVPFTRLGIVVAQMFTALPYAIRITYATFNSINVRYELVSRSLGYSEYETFRKITLPLAQNGLLGATVITFARCMGAFGAVLILAGGSFMKTEILPITLYLNISYGNIGMAITSGIVLILVSFVTIIVFEKLEREA